MFVFLETIFKTIIPSPIIEVINPTSPPTKGIISTKLINNTTNSVNKICIPLLSLFIFVMINLEHPIANTVFEIVRATIRIVIAKPEIPIPKPPVKKNNASDIANTAIIVKIPIPSDKGNLFFVSSAVFSLKFGAKNITSNAITKEYRSVETIFLT